MCCLQCPSTRYLLKTSCSQPRIGAVSSARVSAHPLTDFKPEKQAERLFRGCGENRNQAASCLQECRTPARLILSLRHQRVGWLSRSSLLRDTRSGFPKEKVLYKFKVWLHGIIIIYSPSHGPLADPGSRQAARHRPESRHAGNDDVLNCHWRIRSETLAGITRPQLRRDMRVEWVRSLSSCIERTIFL